MVVDDNETILYQNDIFVGVDKKLNGIYNWLDVKTFT